MARNYHASRQETILCRLVDPSNPSYSIVVYFWCLERRFRSRSPRVVCRRRLDRYAAEDEFEHDRSSSGNDERDRHWIIAILFRHNRVWTRRQRTEREAAVRPRDGGDVRVGSTLDEEDLSFFHRTAIEVQDLTLKSATPSRPLISHTSDFRHVSSPFSGSCIIFGIAAERQLLLIHERIRLPSRGNGPSAGYWRPAIPRGRLVPLARDTDASTFAQLDLSMPSRGLDQWLDNNSRVALKAVFFGR